MAVEYGHFPALIRGVISLVAGIIVHSFTDKHLNSYLIELLIPGVYRKCLSDLSGPWKMIVRLKAGG